MRDWKGTCTASTGRIADLQLGEEPSSAMAAAGPRCYQHGNVAAARRCAETPEERRNAPDNPTDNAWRCKGTWRGSVFRPAPAPGLSRLQHSSCMSTVQLCVAQPNDVIQPGAFLLDGEEHLGRKELVLDICGKQRRKVKSSPISETIIGAGCKHRPSDTPQPSNSRTGH